MKIEQVQWTQADGWKPNVPGALNPEPQLVLVFGSPSALNDRAVLKTVQEAYPGACHFGCSTAGEICDTRVTDESLVVTAVHFEHTTIEAAHTEALDAGGSLDAGKRLAEAIPHKGLRHVFVLSDGLHVNGSELVRGLQAALPEDVPVTGGLSGDGDRFQETYVLWNGLPEVRRISAIGFYGSRLVIGHGSLGGWDAFGPERLVTRSRGHVLYELDGKSALSLYRSYLGVHAAGLPATGLLFPLSLRVGGSKGGLVRTILSIDEEAQSMTFAGDIPEGAYARLMKANFDRLIDGAVGAARSSFEGLGSAPAELAVLISCVGRKLVLRQRIEEEVEGVREVLGAQAMLAGFYSYGEISPFAPTAKCELHNQTMTITTFAER